MGQDKAIKKKSPETTNNRPAQDSSGGSTRLPAQISSGGAVCHRLRTAPGPACVSWDPAPASRRRTAPGAPCVTGLGSSGAGTCPVGSSTSLPAQDNSESVACPRSSGPEEKCQAKYLRNRASDDFFSTRHLAQGSSEGSACPRGSGPNEDRRADAEDLAEPARCKATPIRSKRNIAQGR
jgi:hypothetical protein